MANAKSYQIILKHLDGRPLLRLIADCEVEVIDPSAPPVPDLPARKERQNGPAPAQGDGQPRHLHQPAGNQRRNRIVAQTEPGAGSRSNRNHVLHRPAQLGARKVVVRIESQRPPGEIRLHLGGCLAIARSDRPQAGKPAPPARAR